MIRPAPRAFVALGVASLVCLVSWRLALTFDALILALIYWDGTRIEQPTVRREAPASGVIGLAADVLVVLSNRSQRVVRTVVTDDIDARLERTDESEGPRSWDEGHSLSIPAGTTVRVVYRVRPLTRGFLRLGTLHLRTSGPWNLAWQQTRSPDENIIRVQPGIRDLVQRKDSTLKRQLLQVGPRRTRRWGDGSEFESLREYTKGDDPRTIDWKASAKRGRHVVRNYEAERNQNVILALDAGRHMREQVGDRERLDYALSACLLLASRAQAYGDRVGLMVFDDQVRQVMPAARVNLSRLSETLTGVTASLVEPNYPLAMATLGRTFRKRSLVVLFTDVIDQTVSRVLVESVLRVSRSHLPLTIAIRNPDLEAVASTPATSDEVAFRRAAAEELIQSRATALHRMRRAGILIVDSDPAQILSGALSKYVEVKERGLL